MASTGEVWKLGHRPALDGVRGIAVLLVLAYHATGQGGNAAGAVGVTCFFTLSGFLITALLLEERDRNGRVDLTAFYLRRVRRLLPALAAFLAVMVPLGTLLPRLADPRALPAVGVYVANWIPANSGHLYALSHLWSLSVEEQFYLLWPLSLVVAAWLCGERGVGGVAAAGIVASMVARLALWDGGAGADRIYYGTDTRADALLLGCLAAVLVRAGLRSPRLTVPAAMVGLVAASLAADRFIVGPILASWLTVVVVVGVASSPQPFFPAWLRLVGRRSYALYLWHFPLVYYFAPRMGGPRVIAIGAMLALAWLLALASWRYVERPFLRLPLGQLDEADGGAIRRWHSSRRGRAVLDYAPR